VAILAYRIEYIDKYIEFYKFVKDNQANIALDAQFYVTITNTKVKDQYMARYNAILEYADNYDQMLKDFEKYEKEYNETWNLGEG